MKTITVLVGLLLTTLPAAAQSRVYTNRDLTPRPVTAWTRTVTPAELAGLASRQFVYVPPPRLEGPTAVILATKPLFEPFEPTRPLSEPWSMTTYVGRGYRQGFRSHEAPSVARPGIHLRYP
jgi:hypothetical protein